MWRNRQTRYVQGVVGVTPWEFESPPRHQAIRLHSELRCTLTIQVIHYRQRGWPLVPLRS